MCPIFLYVYLETIVDWYAYNLQLAVKVIYHVSSIGINSFDLILWNSVELYTVARKFTHVTKFEKIKLLA